ncbi:DUF2267 domain-containing protein [Micromonospora sp. NPDC049662]|uniref:DUF2267 domain-containing protein n=1 Tax=Micromonospora sp. NPDC049662 TaxID=3155397 RepID=UPI00342E459D
MTDSAGGDGFGHFIDAVSRRSGLPTGQAAALARAVLTTMAERVTGAAPDPAGHLPDQVDGYLYDFAPDAHPTDPVPAVTTDGDGLDAGVGLVVGGPATPPPMDAGPVDFLRRVSQRAGVDAATARLGTGAVFATLREAVTVREFHEMVARLPRDGSEPDPAWPTSDW